MGGWGIFGILGICWGFLRFLLLFFVILIFLQLLGIYWKFLDIFLDFI
jgi:hypothetical protein